MRVAALSFPPLTPALSQMEREVDRYGSGRHRAGWLGLRLFGLRMRFI